jgi:hypothetical protein
MGGEQLFRLVLVQIHVFSFAVLLVCQDAQGHLGFGFSGRDIARRATQGKIQQGHL